jgi:hypothetical protein
LQGNHFYRIPFNCLEKRKMNSTVPLYASSSIKWILPFLFTLQALLTEWCCRNRRDSLQAVFVETYKPRRPRGANGCNGKFLLYKSPHRARTRLM